MSANGYDTRVLTIDMGIFIRFDYLCWLCAGVTDFVSHD